MGWEGGGELRLTRSTRHKIANFIQVMRIYSYLYGFGALGHILEKAFEQVGYANVGAGDDAHLELDFVDDLL